MKNLFNLLPIEIIHKILIMSIKKKKKKPDTACSWCCKCGEMEHLMNCPYKMCGSCCKIQCIDNGHWIKNCDCAPPRSILEIEETLYQMEQHNFLNS
jgi:hypothetical protein